MKSTKRKRNAILLKVCPAKGEAAGLCDNSPKIS
jgi:hypothetical protein